MTRRFTLFTCLLIVSLAVAVAFTQLVGHPQPIIAAIFTNPDGTPCELPCMFGIVPGSTTLSDMFGIADSHPVLKNLSYSVSIRVSGRSYEFSDANQEITVNLDNNNVVQSISWGNSTCSPSTLPTVADLIQLLGSPDRVGVQPSRLQITQYFYAKYHVAIESSRQSLKMICKSGAGNLRLSPQDVILDIALEGTGYAEQGIPWHGFRSAQSYYTDDR